MSSITLKKACNRPEFWIILFFLIRLIGITNPPIEISHNWRQVTGLMVSRNFLETDPTIFYPRIDDNQGSEGIIGMEFPLLNYLYFLMAKIFGYTHWYGRLLNLIISSLGILFFSKIISKYFEHRIVLTSTLCLLASIWFAFSRKMMPDTFCVSLMFMGVFFGTEYIDKGKFLNIILSVLFTTLAILSKIPAGIYFMIFILLLLEKNNLTRKLTIIATTVIPLLLTYTWYFVWNPHLSKEYGIWYNSGTAISTGFYEIISHVGLALDKFYFSSFNSYIFTACFISGLFIMFIKQNKKMICLFLSMFLIFLIYIFKSGYFFYHHSYYIIPFVPVMALVAGYAISLIKKQWLYIAVLSIGIIESIANQQNDFFNKETEKYKLNLEVIADSISKRNDLIVINGNENPQQIYLAHRKGWNCTNHQLSDSLYIKDISLKGCKFIFINKHSCEDVLNKKIVFNNKDYCVYELAETN